MGRLKKEHSGYRTHGLWLKYQTPKINDSTVKVKSKKDTNRWCRGKVGIEHEWHRYQDRWFDYDIRKYVDYYVRLKCLHCKKEKYTKRLKAKDAPLHLFVNHENDGYSLIQVNVNGKYLPITHLMHEEGRYWCEECGTWHWY